MTILKILSILNVLLFILLILFKKDLNRNRFFLLYIISTLPLLSISVLFNFNGFVIIISIYLLFFLKKSNTKINWFYYYYSLVSLFIFTVITGLFVSEFSLENVNLIDSIDFLFTFIYVDLLIHECIESSVFVSKIVYALKFVLLISFVFLLVQILIGLQFTLSIHQNPNIVSSDGFRYPSFFSDPQVYGQFLGCMAFISFIHGNEHFKNKYLSFLYLFGCLIAILLSGARSGFIGLCIGFFFLIIFSRNKIKLILIPFIATLTVLVYLLRNQFVMFNRGTPVDEAYEFRSMIWKAALNIFSDHSIVGIGLGNYSRFVQLYYPDQVWLRDHEYLPFDHPENGYLKILTETGAIGFFVFLLFILLPIIYTLKKSNSNIPFFTLLLIASIITWMISFYSTYTLGDIRIKLFLATILSLLIYYNIGPNNDNKRHLFNHVIF